MGYTLNEKLRSMTPYTPITQEYAIRADANESFIRIPEDRWADITTALKEEPLNRYPDPYARRVVEPFSAYHGYDPDLVTAGNGSDELLSVIIGSFLDEGDVVATVEPDFSMYSFYAYISGHRAVDLGRRDDLSIDIDVVIEGVRRENARMFLFSNPGNPVPLQLPRSDVIRLVESLPDRLIVLDEAYMDFGDASCADLITSYDNLLVLRTCSKALGAAGIRLGFALANKTITNAIRAAKSPYNVSRLTQTIGGILLRDKAFLDGALAAILASRDDLYARLQDIERAYPAMFQLYPTHTNFALLKTPHAKAIQQALQQRSISIRAFDGYLRITACTMEDNETIARNLRELLDILSTGGSL